jgi:DEAD/DEAH box helicase domain-containing protein
MKQIILDVETKKTFDEVGGYFPEKLEASFIGLIERDGFPEDGDCKEMRHELFENDFHKLPSLLEHADVLVGFNITGFDLPALQPYYPGDIMLLPQLDLLDVIKNVAGHRISLDAVAKETLNTQKIGHGLDAITYYQNKEFDKLAKYCMKDVEITRDLYDFGRVNHAVKFLNKWNNKVEITVDFSFTPKATDGLQMTLI